MTSTARDKTAKIERKVKNSGFDPIMEVFEINCPYFYQYKVLIIPIISSNSHY